MVTAPSTHFRRAALAAALALAAVAPAAAQPAPAQPRFVFDLPAQSLDTALTTLADRAGLRLMMRSQDVAGRMAPALSGSLTADEALARLLAGSGFVHRYINATTVTLVAAPSSSGAVTLDPVTVEGAAGRGVWGPLPTRGTSGSKTDTPLLETPQSVSVVTREEMAARGVATIKDAVGYSAGVTPSASTDFREDLITFRGFPYDWASAFLDGLQMPSSTYANSTVEPYGLERLEVLKGPASMLYGQTSTGGIINMQSKRPTSTPVNEVEAKVGNHERYQGAFDVGGAAGADGDVAVRMVGLLRRSAAEVEHVRDDRVFLAPSLAWRPTDRTTLTLMASYQRDDLGDSGGTQAFLPASGIALPNPNGKIARSTNGGEPAFDYYRKTQASVGYDLDHAIDDTWSVQQTLRFRRVDLDYQTAYGVGLDPADPSQRTLRRSAFGSFGSARALGIDSRAQARWGSGAMTHVTLFGVDYRRTVVEERNYFGPGPSIDIFAPVYGAPIALPASPYADQTVESRQIGLYAQDQATIAERWVLTLGARWDRAETDVSERMSGTEFSRTDHRLTGRAGLTYKFDNGVAPYASAATSFTPTIEPNLYGAPYEPRTGRQYEIGVKVQPPGSSSLFTAAVFDLVQQNVLTADPDQVNHPFGQIQTGEFRSRGLELEAKVTLLDGLTATGAYTFLDAEYTKSNTDNLGNAPKGIPKHSASLWLDYAFPEAVAEGVSVGGGARYVGDRPNTDSDTGRFMMPAFTVLDAALRYDTGGYQLALNVTNLTDKTIYDCWNNRCWYGQGRTVVATVKHRW